MYFPQFSLRWLLTVTAACGGFFVILAQAYAGEQWALAVCVAAVSLAVVAVFHAVLFAGFWLLSLFATPLRRPAGAGVSPFAAAPARTAAATAEERALESHSATNGAPPS